MSGIARINIGGAAGHASALQVRQPLPELFAEALPQDRVLYGAPVPVSSLVHLLHAPAPSERQGQEQRQVNGARVADRPSVVPAAPTAREPGLVVAADKSPAMAECKECTARRVQLTAMDSTYAVCGKHAATAPLLFAC